jgi:hypothetical protein
MALPFAGAAFNYKPGQLSQAFAPGNKNIFNVDLTQKTPASAPSGFSSGQNSKIQGLPAFMEQIRGLGEFPQALAISQYMGQQPSIVDQILPLEGFMQRQDALRVKNANDLAEKKFFQEIAGAGIGALGRGITTAVAGGDSGILYELAKAPLTGAEMFQRGLQTQFTPAQPMSPQQYQPRKYFA